MMNVILWLDRNITYKKNLLKEKEISFDLQRDSNIKIIEDLDLQIEDLKKEFSKQLITKKQVIYLFNLFFYAIFLQFEEESRRKCS